MRRILSIIAIAAIAAAASAQTPKDVKLVYTEGSTLTLTGKLCPDTPNPYHRVDTVKYKGFTKTENGQVRMASGIAVAFRTNSTILSVQTVYGDVVSFPNNGNGVSSRGYDLYIKKDGKWLWAASVVAGDGKGNGLEKPAELIRDMDPVEHECLLYLPLYSEVYSVKIGTEEGSSIEPLDNPFRYRVGVFGSSYTHGSSTSRGGMTWPAQFSRKTGIQLLSLGCSGNSKLQPYFAEVLKDADVDAFIFDGFSNPNPKMIETRLFPFIEKIQSTHPGVPLIFLQTIYRENRNFSNSKDKGEQDKLDMAAKMMKEACAKYKDVYYVTTTDAHADCGLATVDGVHPDNYGYTLWAQSIEKPVLRILRKYGIR